MSGCIAAMPGLQSCNLIRRGTAGDQDGAAADSVARPAERPPYLGRPRDDLFGIEMQHGHGLFGVGDLGQRRLRATPGQAGRRPADGRAGRRASRT